MTNVEIEPQPSGAFYRKEKDTVLEMGPLESIFPCSVSKILDFLVTFRDYDYSISDISKNSGVGFKTTLNEIHRLEDQEVIQKTRTIGKAMMYKLNPVSNQAKSISNLAIDIATRRMEKTEESIIKTSQEPDWTNELRHAKLKEMIMSKAYRSLNKLPNKGLKTTGASAMTIIQGRPNIYSRIGKMIEESSKTIYVVTTPEDILRMCHSTIPDKIKSCKNKGVEIRVFTDILNENLVPLIKRLNASEIRVGKLPSKSRVIVEEGGQLIMSGSIKETMDLNDDNDSILYTNSQEMVGNMFQLCSHLWKNAKPVDALQNALKN